MPSTGRDMIATDPTPEGFPVGPRLRSGRFRSMSRRRRAAQGRPAAGARGALGRRPGRTPRRDAVREGVAAHALDVRDRDSRARRAGADARAGRGARQPRAGRRRRAQSRAMDRRGDHQDVLAAAASGIRGVGEAPARHQRPHRRPAPVPGAVRLPDSSRTLGIPARPDDCLRRRRQQRRGVPRPCRGHGRRASARRQPRGLPAV